MRNPLQIGLAAAVIVLLAMTGVLYQQVHNTKTALHDTQAAERTARSQYADAFNSIAEIQDSLNAINTADGNVSLSPNGLQGERRLTGPSREEALQSIATLNASIERAKQRIGRLEHQLNVRGVKVAGLERMLTQLKQSVVDKQEQIAALTLRVDELSTQVAGLETTVLQNQDSLLAQSQNIEDKRRELGTIYYVIGTKKELANSGLVVAKGGVLGMGKTLQLSGSYPDAAFTALDTDQESTVLAPGDKLGKVKVLSPQPTASYELRLAGNQVELHILDAKEFRKVKHLVIMTG